MFDYAEWLANFLEWAERRNVALDTCGYATDVAGKYQSEMLNGEWSKDGAPKKASTVNARVQQACDFLNWMVSRGFRKSFEVPYESSSLPFEAEPSTARTQKRSSRARRGRVRTPVTALNMPSSAAVREWLQRIHDISGPISYLMCETVVRTAMRREEVVCLRVDTLPENPADWHITNPDAPESAQLVRILIKFGTKGPSYGRDHGDKIGPEDPILIPLGLAKKWHEYRNGHRLKAFKNWMAGVKGAEARRKRAADAVHLFLHEADGERFSGKQFYDLWVSVELPCRGWSPHKGRHWWACVVLWREINKNFSPVSNETPVVLLTATAQSILKLQIQPQLRHSSTSTTETYINWIVQMVGHSVNLEEDTDF
ncbi:site-specific integrase [Paraburkholderia sp. RL17-337-BIB-A]|uniref:site-specific integrase n=1 Tax=Paraburkholderia sp. RL17-337-BIB-A TaxID=3031636 RepID=UPI0038B78680